MDGRAELNLERDVSIREMTVANRHARFDFDR
jgi:hypothetical protein